jgi:hypothetical protein
MKMMVFSCVHRPEYEINGKFSSLWSNFDDCLCDLNSLFWYKTTWNISGSKAAIFDSPYGIMKLTAQCIQTIFEVSIEFYLLIYVSPSMQLSELVSFQIF